MKKLFVLLFIFITAGAYSEGYQVNLQSTKQAGMAHTGTGLKLGAESMHFNPAALVYMTKSVDLSGGVSAVTPQARFNDGAGYHAQTDNPVSTPLYLYAGFSIYKDRLAAGISVTTPYGSSLSWGKNWKGASTIQDISLRSFFFQPTVSVKITDGVTFGAGLMVATGSFELSRALMSADRFQALGQRLPAEQQALVQRYAGVVPVSATLGGTSPLRLGYNLGLMMEAGDKVTLGLSYRSKIRMSVDNGDATLDYVSPQVEQLLSATGLVPPLDQGTFRASLPLPSNLTLGVGYRPTDRWTLAFDLQFVGWKAYDKLVVSFNEAALGIDDIVSPKDYKNTFAYRLGAEFAATKRFDVRMGLYLDETPVRSYNYNPETPGANKAGFTTGFTFQPYTDLCIDFAFTFIKGFSRHGSYTNPLDPTDIFSGKYSSTAYIPSIGLSYKF